MTRQIELEQVKPLKAVYAYYFPEVRSVISQIANNYPHETFLQSVNPGLDDFHIPVIERFEKSAREQLPALSNFPFRYSTNGASEGIFHLLSHQVAFAPEQPLYVLKGEYEGYAGYGKNLGLNFQHVDDVEGFKDVKPGRVYISNPSARDGNIIQNTEIDLISDSGHEIIYDATYVGLTKPHFFDVLNPSIKSVLISLSKPFGLYYYRVGFIFSKEPMPTLEPNKWFKNIFSLVVADEVLKNFKTSELATKYRSEQRLATSKLAELFNFEPKESDVLLLANADYKNAFKAEPDMEPYFRGSNYRFCLTPYFLKNERGFV